MHYDQQRLDTVEKKLLDMCSLHRIQKFKKDQRVHSRLGISVYC